MNTFDANWADGRRGALHAVQVVIADRFLSFEGPAVDPRRYDIEALAFQAPLGRLPLQIDLPDGGRVEIGDGQTAYRALSVSGRSSGAFVAGLEEHWMAVATTIVVALCVGWLLLAYAVPAAARPIALLLPDRVERVLGAEALQILDSDVLAPSALSVARQDELRESFRDVQSPGLEHVRVLFRSGARFGPNALALPGGTIVITDALVELAQDDRELLAVVAHEYGHIAGKHALRMVLQNTGAALLVAVAFGDVVSVTSFGAALPTLLLQTGYARDLEREADTWALDRLEEAGIDTAWSARILARLERSREGGNIPEFLSTHPDMEARRAAALERAWDPGLAGPGEAGSTEAAIAGGAKAREDSTSPGAQESRSMSSSPR